MNLQKARVASAYHIPKNLFFSLQVQTGSCLLQQYFHLRIVSVIFSGHWAKVSNKNAAELAYNQVNLSDVTQVAFMNYTEH